MREGFLPILICVVFLVSVSVLVVKGASLAAQATCSSRAEIMQLEYDWGFWSGCLIMTEDGWRPLGGYRMNEDFRSR